MAYKFTQRAARRIVRTTRDAEREPIRLERRGEYTPNRGRRRTIRWTKLTGNALVSGHDARWQYAHTEQDGPNGGDLAGGLTGTTSDGYALNTVELAHIAEPIAATAWYVWGVDAHGDDYPAGFAPRPIGGGGTTGTHKVDIIVPFWVDSDGQVWFTLQGSHDGTCT